MTTFEKTFKGKTYNTIRKYIDAQNTYEQKLHNKGNSCVMAFRSEELNDKEYKRIKHIQEKTTSKLLQIQHCIYYNEYAEDDINEINKKLKIKNNEDSYYTELKKELKEIYNECIW
jgi:hypothetical protein